MVATLIILGTQIAGLMIPPPGPGFHVSVLIGPTVVVLAAIAVNMLILCLLIGTGRKTDNAGVLNRPTRSMSVATKGLALSFLTIFATTIAVNLFIG